MFCFLGSLYCVARRALGAEAVAGVVMFRLLPVTATRHAHCRAVRICRRDIVIMAPFKLPSRL